MQTQLWRHHRVDGAGSKIGFPRRSRDVRGRIARVHMYRYRMAAPLAQILRTAPAERVWWTRAFEEVLIPPVALRADGNLAYFEAPRPPPGNRFVERI